MVNLARGDLLALYTDGLVERRGESIDEGIARLTARLRDIDTSGNLTVLSKTAVTDLAGPTPEDDVALVLVRLDR